MLPNNLKCSESEWKDFILETYIQRYSPGRARANRLINIANVITDRKLKKHEVRGGREKKKFVINNIIN